MFDCITSYVYKNELIRIANHQEHNSFTHSCKSEVLRWNFND